MNAFPIKGIYYTRERCMVRLVGLIISLSIVHDVFHLNALRKHLLPEHRLPSDVIKRRDISPQLELSQKVSARCSIKEKKKKGKLT